jgi:hypothetical protein
MEVVVPGGVAVVEGGGSGGCCELLHCSVMASRERRERKSKGDGSEVAE